jgi:L-threonylcarbamoyladenylate synthase
MAQATFRELIAAAQAATQLISFPTDTIPALAVRPDRADLIYAAKQRPSTKPLILMLGEMAQVWDYVEETGANRQAWERVMAQYWPGALTLVLPASGRVPVGMNPQTSGTIGVRVPNHEVARRILRETGPLATTSVNRSGQPALLDRAAIAAEFPEVLQLSDSALAALQGAVVESLVESSSVESSSVESSSLGQPSTVIQWAQTDWLLLRQGAVVLDDNLFRRS